MTNATNKRVLNLLPLTLGIIILMIGCDSKAKKRSENNSVITNSTSNTSINSDQEDSVSILTDSAWMGPVLLVRNNDVALLKDNYEDTLSLADNIAWLKEYLDSDTLVSVGRSGIQVQQFLTAAIKNPNGDCNRQVVLSLKYNEKRGILAGEFFLKLDSIQFFDHQKAEKSYFINNIIKPSLLEAIFQENTDTLKYDSRSFYVTGNERFVIEKRGNSTRFYNEGLDEEHFRYLNDEYRIAHKTNDNWILSRWTPCLSEANHPEPKMICYFGKEVLIVWGFSEGIGDYQIYVSRVDMSYDEYVFENGKKMQAYISMGCD